MIVSYFITKISKCQIQTERKWFIFTFKEYFLKYNHTSKAFQSKISFDLHMDEYRKP